jgi:hypothetical protein
VITSLFCIVVSPKINTQELLTEMMDYDLKEARREKHIQDGGFKK